MFRPFTEKKYQSTAEEANKPRLACPKCGQPDSIEARILTRWHAPIGHGELPAFQKDDRQEDFPEQIHCTACDYRINIVNITKAKQPTCKECRLTADCASTGSGLYQLTAYLCPDFRWGSPRNFA